jgi:hypothetical protein
MFSDVLGSRPSLDNGFGLRCNGLEVDVGLVLLVVLLVVCAALVIEESLDPLGTSSPPCYGTLNQCRHDLSTCSLGIFSSVIAIVFRDRLILTC